MARSSRIYLVYNVVKNKFLPTIAFTVKHEAITYINLNFKDKKNILLYGGLDGRESEWKEIEIE